MAAAGERPRIQLRGLRGSVVRGAVLALEGASRAELRRASALAALLADQCLLVAVDGGLNTCRRGGRRPDLFVGDGDSAARLPGSVPSVVYARDKSFSDLAGALRELRSRRVHVVVVAGLLGGRLDHEWANILEVGSRSRWFAGIVAPTDRGILLVTSRGCRAVTVRGRLVSVLAMGGGATISLRGTRWTLRRRRVPPGSLGLSNLTGKAFDLTVHRGVVAVVFPAARRRAV
jgi:thiamine pyrophosphokinase